MAILPPLNTLINVITTSITDFNVYIKTSATDFSFTGSTEAVIAFNCVSNVVARVPIDLKIIGIDIPSSVIVLVTSALFEKKPPAAAPTVDPNVDIGVMIAAIPFSTTEKTSAFDFISPGSAPRLRAPISLTIF